MMTTMAALVGTLPIAAGWAPAPKSGAARPAVVGGLLLCKCSPCT